MQASCYCGALTVRVSGEPYLTVACHCTNCQRRTGSAFGIGVFFPASAVTVAGAAKIFERTGPSGGKVCTRFCPDCGSTLYWTADRAPGLIAVAAGCFADANLRHPDRSIWEDTKQAWLTIDADHHAAQSTP